MRLGSKREIHFHIYYRFPIRLAMFKKYPDESFPLTNSASRLMWRLVWRTYRSPKRQMIYATARHALTPLLPKQDYKKGGLSCIDFKGNVSYLPPEALLRPEAT